jgi:PAS domain S-box-containing protein
LLSTIQRIDGYNLERGREFEALALNAGVLTSVASGKCVSSDEFPTLKLPFSKNGWERIFVTDDTGTVCSATMGGSTLNTEEKSAVAMALRGVHTQSDMIFSSDLAEPNTLFAVPVLSASGTVQAVIGGRLNADEYVRILDEGGYAAQLRTKDGMVLANSKSTRGGMGGKISPDPSAVWNFASTLSADAHGVMNFGGSKFVVAEVSEPGIAGYSSKEWKLVGVEDDNILYGDNFALLGAALFGLLSVFFGLLFFGRMPLRLVRELRQISFYTEQQLRGVTEFIPRDKEVELKNVYGVIERLAMRYHVLARTRDESTIKLAQDLEAYRQERDRYAVMIGAMREGACALNNEGVITLCNLSAANMLGRSRDEIIGKHYKKVFRLYLDEDLKSEFDALEKALLSGGVFAEEGPYYVRQPAGGGLPVRIQSTVIRQGADRAPIGIFVLMRDVGKELAVEQAKNEFISVTSHQMRTPLATMRWQIERLLRPGAPHTQATLRDYLQRIERNNKRMIRLADALLDVSRIDLDVAKGKNDEIDVPGVVKEVLDEIDEQTLTERTILQHYDEIKGQKIQCDPYLVRVVFENFIENAIAYTKSGGTIEVHVGMDGDSLRIDVKDDGIGIAPDMKEKIFSKFIRGKDATAMSPEGTGLGLYITKSLVERAGGKIWFASNRNSGSTFSVRIPLSDPNNN